MQNFSYFIPTKLFFGCGSINNLATVSLPGKKALIVISAGTSMRKYGYLEKVENAIAQNGATSVVYDKILPNPTKTHVMEAAEICRRERCDFVIGLGGGSSIDSAKSIAVMACNEGDYWDYIGGGSGKGKSIKGALPVVAIPTTAGTGTEMDPWTVITNGNEKIGYGNEYTFPVFSIVDPDLMMSVPAHLTAYQGFDAFFHASEGYLANVANPISRLYSLKSIALLYQFLPRAVADGSDVEARTNVALASTLAGIVESTSGCISQHSLEHAMSAFYPKLPHGAGLISLSLVYFATFMNDVPELFMEMAESMMGRKSSDPADFIAALATMQKACNVDHIKLSEYGISESDLPKFVQNAKETMGGLFSLDPHPLNDEEILSIYKQSYE